MRTHFFTAPFYFAFIWFRVQGSGVSWRLRRLFLEDGILVSLPSPRGEGFVRRYCFSTHACIRSVDMGIAVLSYTDRLRRSPPLFFILLEPYPARCTRCLPHGGRLWDMGKGKNDKKDEPKGSPFLFAKLACVSEVAGRYRAKARKRAGLERCDRVSCGIQFISRG